MAIIRSASRVAVSLLGRPSTSSTVEADFSSAVVASHVSADLSVDRHASHMSPVERYSPRPPGSEVMQERNTASVPVSNVLIPRRDVCAISTGASARVP